jgi:hypothetical protein
MNFGEILIFSQGRLNKSKNIASDNVIFTSVRIHNSGTDLNPLVAYTENCPTNLNKLYLSASSTVEMKLQTYFNGVFKGI